MDRINRNEWTESTGMGGQGSPEYAGSGIDVLDVSKDLPIIALVYTNWDSDQVYKQCMERKVKGFIAKTDSLTVIGDKIVRQLKDMNMYFPK